MNNMMDDLWIKKFNVPKTRKEAINLGFKKYFTGDPCSRGHICERTVATGCIECEPIYRERFNSQEGARERANLASKKSKEKHDYKNNRKKLSFSPENIKRADEAASNGEKFFVPERPCPKGHFLRFVSSNNCVECSRAVQIKNKEINKHHRLKREYGINKEEYDLLLEKQKWCCAICGKHESIKFKLHTDHNHETGKVRGLLCNKCNQGIGLLQDSTDILKSAIKYLERDEKDK